MMSDPSETALIYKAMGPYFQEYKWNKENFPLDWFYDNKALANYTFVLPFEIKFNRARMIINSHNMWILSILVSLAYILLIFVGRKLMSYREKPFDLRGPLIMWDICLATFSAIGFFRVSHEFFGTLSNHGFMHSVCSASYGKDVVASFWMSIFVYSKFMDLVDTVFLILRKKPVIFLHWYHHVTALVFSWHCTKGGVAAARWYAWMNYGVHMVMYSYYAIRAMNYRFPPLVSILVTSVQLFQMILGIGISYFLFRAKFDWNIACHQNWANLEFALAIYGSYFLLFAKYFYDAYLKKGVKKVKVDGRQSKVA